MPFVAAGAVTGIGSLPLTTITSAIRSVAEFSPEVPFGLSFPNSQKRESIVGQGLAIVEGLIEPRNDRAGLNTPPEGSRTGQRHGVTSLPE